MIDHLRRVEKLQLQPDDFYVDVCWCPSGSQLAVASHSGLVMVFDVEPASASVLTFGSNVPFAGRLRRFAIHPTCDPPLILLSCISMPLLFVRLDGSIVASVLIGDIVGRAIAPHSLCFNADGSRLAVGSVDGVRLYSVRVSISSTTSSRAGSTVSVAVSQLSFVRSTAITRIHRPGDPVGEGGTEGSKHDSTPTRPDVCSTSPPPSKRPLAMLKALMTKAVAAPEAAPEAAPAVASTAEADVVTNGDVMHSPGAPSRRKTRATHRLGPISAVALCQPSGCVVVGGGCDRGASSRDTRSRRIVVGMMGTFRGVVGALIYDDGGERGPKTWRVVPFVMDSREDKADGETPVGEEACSATQRHVVHRGGVSDVRISNDGRWGATLGRKFGDCYFWDVLQAVRGAGPAGKYQVESSTPQRRPFVTLHTASLGGNSGLSVVVGGRDGFLSVFGATSVPACSVPVADEVAAVFERRLPQRSVSAAAISPCGSLLAVAFGERVWKSLADSASAAQTSNCDDGERASTPSVTSTPRRGAVHESSAALTAPALYVLPLANFPGLVGAHGCLNA